MNIPFNEGTQKRIDSGELVPVAVFLFEPVSGLLVMHGLGPVTLAEAKAILRQFIDDIPAPIGEDG